ncbi:MAG: histidinol-phosphatase HisJ family protein [Lachnospiraceae bacterium]|nr:histidinol-phosphatase HisJ family protein [Lachnospiraceae bacterium]
MQYLSNAHTHSIYCDGKDTPEEMVLEAIRRGYTSLGFSGHSYLPFDDPSDPWTMTPEKEKLYIREVSRLKEVYKDRITIYLGTELDSFSRIDLSPYDYYIGSVHMYQDPETGKHYGYDGSTATFLKIYREFFHEDELALARHYYTQVAEHMATCKAPILGHYNLITKHNKELHLIHEDEPAYKAIASEALLAAAEHAVCVEVNTGAIARGRTDVPYPNRWMLQLLKEHHIPVILTCDCHDRSHLSDSYDLALDILRDVGYTSLLTLGKHSLFEEIPLE